MTINEDPNAPVTRFTSMNVVPATNNILEGDFFGFPQLSQEEIDSIPAANLLPGIVVYNTTHNVYMAYFINEDDDLQNRWMNVNTSLTYKGEGFEVGSPFALPAGPRSVVEALEANMDPGVMYIDTENGDIPRIYIPATGWQDVGVGGSSETFTNINVSDTTTTNNLNVTNIATINEGDFVNINVSDTATIKNANIEGLYVSEGATLTNLVVQTGITTEILSVNNRARINHLQIGSPADQGVLFGVSVIPTQDAGIGVTLGTAAGTGATFTMKGSPLSGVFTLTTGTSLSGTIIASFSLPDELWQAYSATFAAIFMPADTVTFGDSLGAVVTTSVFSLSDNLNPAVVHMTSGGGTQLADNRTYKWNYIIIGNIYGSIG